MCAYQETDSTLSAACAVISNISDAESKGVMSKIHYVLPGDIDCGQRKKKTRRARRPTLASALRQARKVGASVSGATISADGSVTITFGQPTVAESENEWDTVQ